VAELGAQAAEALDHAHEMGVLHRDIKPSNLLLDGTGKLWISDFGLAHLEDQDGSAARGDVVGTVRYMSPEQARATRAPVDHRTDVYSLGATLYELIALRPAYPGNDRDALFRQIALNEPPRLRRHNPSTPVELETVILKAMARSPVERYPDARALAEDLRRFLHDRPIAARRPTLPERGRKWMRRHPALSTTVAGVLLLLSGALAFSAVLLWQERTVQETALLAARDSRRKADVNYARTLEVVDRMLALVGEAPLEPAPGLNRVRAGLLGDALEFYGEALDRKPTDVELRGKVARIRRYRGRYLVRLGRANEGVAEYRRALELLESLGADESRSRSIRHDRVRVEIDLGELLSREPATREDGDALLRRAVGRLESWIAADPADTAFRRSLAHGLQVRAAANGKAGRRDEAATDLFRAVEIMEEAVRTSPGPENRRELGTLCNALGTLFLQQGRAAEAEKPFRRGVAIQRALLAEDPEKPRFRRELGALLANLALVFHRAERPAEAETALREAVEHQRAALAANRHDRQSRTFLWNHYWNLADLLVSEGRHADAAAAARALTRVRPQHLGSHLEAVRYLLRCGEMAAGDAATANRYRDEARAIVDGLVPQIGGQPAALEKVAWLLLQAPDPSFRQPRRAAALARKATELAPKVPEPRVTLALALYRAGEYDRAIQVADRVLEAPGVGDARAGFVAAMALAARGEHAAARARFESAARRMDEKGASGARCRRLREEAARALENEQKKRP